MIELLRRGRIARRRPCSWSARRRPGRLLLLRLRLLARPWRRRLLGRLLRLLRRRLGGRGGARLRDLARLGFGFGFWFGLGLLGALLRRRGGLIDLLLRLLVALHQLGRDALGHARHAFREDRLAIARQLGLGVPELEVLHRLAAAERAAERHQKKRQSDSAHDAHRPSPQPLPVSPASAIRISTRLRSADGVSASSRTSCDHLRRPAVSPPFHAEKASSSRALWRNGAPAPASGSSRRVI